MLDLVTYKNFNLSLSRIISCAVFQGGVLSAFLATQAWA